MIILGGDKAGKQKVFESVEVVGSVSSTYAMPYENDLRIYLCRGLKMPLATFWPQLQDYN